MKIICRLCCFSSFFFLLFGCEEGDEGLGVDSAVVVDVHGVKGVVDFFGAEFISPGHKSVTESGRTKECHGIHSFLISTVPVMEAYLKCQTL